ncbi:uncharacterized protein LOC113835904 [Cricetulus griseus]|uniref:Uncharacterized protein LOC113835904 n=1 Tax=Cricetulus griseus TaxID=10029 RepID=A0A9J7G2Y2_CRIGR|nr:uncharacterized protein LOC113835904 [Cricetulus griseus]XP_027293954.2 uncharacterized protein LOC113835904 [Cricetulus griseus]
MGWLGSKFSEFISPSSVQNRIVLTTAETRQGCKRFCVLWLLAFAGTKISLSTLWQPFFQKSWSTSDKTSLYDKKLQGFIVRTMLAPPTSKLQDLSSKVPQNYNTISFSRAPPVHGSSACLQVSGCGLQENHSPTLFK